MRRLIHFEERLKIIKSRGVYVDLNVNNRKKVVEQRRRLCAHFGAHSLR